MGDSPTTKSIIQNFIRPRGCQEPFVSKIISPKALRKKFWKERAHEKDVCPKGPGAGGGSRRRYSAFKLRRCSRTIQQVGWRRVCRPAILLENRKDGLLRLGGLLWHLDLVTLGEERVEPEDELPVALEQVLDPLDDSLGVDAARIFFLNFEFRRERLFFRLRFFSTPKTLLPTLTAAP